MLGLSVGRVTPMMGPWESEPEPKAMAVEAFELPPVAELPPKLELELLPKPELELPPKLELELLPKPELSPNPELLPPPKPEPELLLSPKPDPALVEAVPPVVLESPEVPLPGVLPASPPVASGA
jgi:hypothetical protein